MSALLPPTRMRPCSAKSRSFLRGGPDGPACGASTWTTPVLWRSHRARQNRSRNKIRITKVSTVLGEPRFTNTERLALAGMMDVRQSGPGPGTQSRRANRAALAADGRAFPGLAQLVRVFSGA